MAKHVVNVSVLADVKKLVAGMREAVGAKGLGLLKSGFSKLGAFAAAGLAAAGAATTALVVKSIGAAGELEQQVGAIDAVFKESAGQMHEWGKAAATAVGLTRSEYSQLGTLIGAQLKNAGISMSELAPKTNELIKLGADMSAMFGGSTAEAVGALSSALKGERDPIERYGVSLKQAAIDAEAASLGFQKVGGSFDQEAQAAATLSLIMKQTGDAHGAFARETDTLAHKQQVLSAKWGDFTAQLGGFFLPIATQVVGLLSDSLMPAISELTDKYGPQVQATFNQAKEAIAPLIESFQGLSSQGIGTLSNHLQVFMPLWQSLQTLFQTVISFVTGALLPSLIQIGGALAQAFAPFAQILLTQVYPAIITIANAVLPVIGQILQALTPLITTIVGVLSPAIQTLGVIVEAVFGAMAGIVQGAMKIISGIIKTVTSIIKGDWQGAWEGIKQIFEGIWQQTGAIVQAALTIIQALIKGGLNQARNIAKAALDAVIQVFKGAFETMAGAVQAGIKAIIGFMSGLPSRIVSALGNLGGLLLGAGKSIMQGFLNGLKAAWGAVQDFVGGIASWIAANKGPIEKDRSLLVPAGKAIMQGLRTGLISELPALRNTLGTVEATISGINPAIGAPRLAMAGATPGMNVTINVHALEATPEVGRRIAQALGQYQHLQGADR
ncbi:phage tail protein [Mobiluncus porci]|uniref:Phage-related protein n=1 Tax=Mobiluncus porci TaxID=2652278 RepID=A0A7K0K256_9ACTO|nr:hypothetical protein [Mobiluncus porci]MST49498.1 hypothetical protein [Mobiluncus porci]